MTEVTMIQWYALTLALFVILWFFLRFFLKRERERALLLRTIFSSIFVIFLNSTILHMMMISWYPVFLRRMVLLTQNCVERERERKDSVCWWENCLWEWSYDALELCEQQQQRERERKNTQSLLFTIYRISKNLPREKTGQSKQVERCGRSQEQRKDSIVWFLWILLHEYYWVRTRMWWFWTTHLQQRQRRKRRRPKTRAVAARVSVERFLRKIFRCIWRW